MKKLVCCFILLLALLPASVLALDINCDEPNSISVDFPYKIPVALLLKEPFKSPESIIESFSAAGKLLRSSNDPRGLFLEVYATTIQGVFTYLRAGNFQNPEWVRSLLINYANVYREIIYNEIINSKKALPPSWAHVFEVINDEERKISSELMATMEVHISRDMVHALLLSNTNFKSASIESDYLKIAKSLETQTPKIWKIINSYGKVKEILPAKWQEKILLQWTYQLRKQAWRNAEAKSMIANTKQRLSSLSSLEEEIISNVDKINVLGEFIN